MIEGINKIFSEIYTTKRVNGNVERSQRRILKEWENENRITWCRQIELESIEFTSKRRDKKEIKEDKELNKNGLR